MTKLEDEKCSHDQITEHTRNSQDILKKEDCIKVRYKEFGGLFGFWFGLGFFHLIASRQVRILFSFTKVLNVFAAVYISLHHHHREQKPLYQYVQC